VWSKLDPEKEHRRELHEKMERLYDVRSRLVHAGARDELRPDHLELLRRIVKVAMVRFMTMRPFMDMRMPKEVEDWFEQKLLGIS